jgi:hypothetical protein
MMGTRPYLLQITDVTLWQAISIVALCASALATGCTRGGGTAAGAGSIEELVEKYRVAHQERSIEKLRDILWWEAPQAGSAHREDLEQLMLALCSIELEKVNYVAGPNPKERGYSIIYYVRSDPGQRRQFSGVGGPVFGKLTLDGHVSDTGGEREVNVDPCYIVMTSENRYFIDTNEFVLEDAVRSVRTGEPSRSNALPFGTHPTEVEGGL